MISAARRPVTTVATGASRPRARPLWPQLEAILQAEHMVGNFDKVLDQLAVRAGWTAGEIRTKMFRHTYCAARLQTLDQGAPVSPYTAGRELGHGGDALVRRVYGHLGTVRHRTEVVEYRVEQFEEALRDRLAAVRAAPSVTTAVTAAVPPEASAA